MKQNSTWLNYILQAQKARGKNVDRFFNYEKDMSMRLHQKAYETAQKLFNGKNVFTAIFKT